MGVLNPSKKDKYRRDWKGRRCCLRDVLECCTNHLPARVIWRKVFDRASISGGWRCKPPDHPFIKASIPPSSLYSFFCRRRLFFIGDLVSPLLRFYCVFHYSIHFNTWMVTHPSAIQYPWPKLLNFSDLTGTGVSNLVLPLFYSSFSSNHPDANAARNWINSIPPAAGMTFAFSSVFILLQRMSKPLVSSPLSSPRKTSMDESALDAKAGLILCIQRDCPTHPRWSFFIWEKGGDHMRVFIYGWS